MKKRHLLSAAALGFGVAYTAYTAAMFSLASCRDSGVYNKTEKNRRKKISPDKEEYNEMRMDCAAKLRKKNLTVISIKSFDGLHLTAHWMPCKNAKRTVIVMHGYRSSWDREFAIMSDFFSENKCNVLFVEQRSHGQSEGKYIAYGVLERFDVQSWANKVRKITGDGLPLYLMGISMGAATVMMSTALPFAKKINGVIADCGYTSPVDELKYSINKGKRNPLDLVVYSAQGLFHRLAGFKYSDASALEAMRICSVPMLFIHGDADTVVPVGMTYRNFNACTAKKKMLIVSGAGHAMSYYYNRTGYQKALLDFFKEND